MAGGLRSDRGSRAAAEKVEVAIIDATLVQSAAPAKRTPGYEDDIQRLCPPGRGPDEESLIDKVHTGTCEPGCPARSPP
ncbi:MAG: hypothetical protein GDA36_05980 [Rhodobacteraceae bacterium]|nr:hypothetical protein [Paracoccaceae bacterium]